MCTSMLWTGNLWAVFRVGQFLWSSLWLLMTKFSVFVMWDDPVLTKPKLTVRCPQSASSSVCMCLFEWGSLSVVHILSLSCELLMRCVSECEDATAGVYWQLIVIKNRMSNVPVCRTLSKTWHAPTLMAHPVCEEVVSWGETSHLCVFESCDQRFCRLASCKSLVRNEYTVVWKKC